MKEQVNDDVYQYCPHCGHRLVGYKCKMICTSDKCKRRIILTCSDM